jgi:hypothetical protein
MVVAKAEQITCKSLDVVHGWRCSQKHLMGQIRKDKDSGNVLYITRRAYTKDEYVPLSAFFAKIYDGEVVCGECGEVRTFSKVKKEGK